MRSAQSQSSFPGLTRTEMVSFAHSIPAIVRAQLSSRGVTKSSWHDSNIAQIVVDRRRAMGTLRLRGRTHDLGNHPKLRYYGQAYCHFRIASVADLFAALDLIRTAVDNAIRRRQSLA